MNNLKNIFVALLMTLVGFSAYSQEKLIQVKGKITDPYTKAPIEGAIVGATGLQISVNTDANGEFVFEIPSLRGTLNAWAVGYYATELPLNGRTEINITLIPENKVGYSETVQVPFFDNINSRDLVSNAVYLDKKNISLNKNTLEQVFLSMPGIKVVDKSGMPGEGSYVSVRGLNSFTGKTDPLIIVDGVPVMGDVNESPIIRGYSRSKLVSLNPRDINNITYLKGADAAVYGSMASNGVIMIETDKATDLDTKVEFIGQYGINMNQITMPLLNVNQYKDYVNSVASTNYGNSADIARYFPYLADPDSYYKYLFNNDTDWQDLIYRPAFMTDNVLKIKGGDAIAKYDISAGYSGNGGQIENTKLDKYYVRLNSDVSLTRKISLATSFSLNQINSQLMEQGMSLETNPILVAMRKAPMLSPYMQDPDDTERPSYEYVGRNFGPNGIGSVNNAISNPLAVVNDIEADSRVYDINARGQLRYKLNDNYSIYGAFGLYYNMNRESIFIPGVTDKTVMPLSGGIANNTVRSGVGETFNIYYSVNGAFNKVFDRIHEVNVTAGLQATMNNTEYDAGIGRNTANDFYKTLDKTNAIGRSFDGYNEKWNWLNFNVKGQYIYNKLVGAGIVIAADRSSATGEDAQLFGVYPSVNAALYLKNAPFLMDVDLVNTLTLRADYSTVANSQYASTLSKYYYVSSKYTESAGIVRAGVPNTKLKPEITSTMSFGVEASLFNNRLDIRADYYNSKSKDLIMLKSISSAFGDSHMYDNVGEVENQGFEVGAQFAVINKSDLNWTLGATLNTNKNKIVSLGNNQSFVTELSDGSALISEVGKSMYSFYGAETNGIYSTTAEALADGYTNFNGQAFSGGDVRFVNKNGDNIINSNDRVNLGDATPDFYGSIYTSVRYRDLELSAIFGYSYGNKAYNATRRLMESESDYANQYRSVASRWAMEGQKTNMPRAYFGDPQGNNRFSDRFIEDASYIKLKELMVSYKLPVFSGITVYAAGENLFTITDYLGMDPEFSYSYSASLQGFDYAKVALARTIKIGVKLQF